VELQILIKMASFSFILCCFFITAFATVYPYQYKNEENTNLDDGIRDLVAEELRNEWFLDEDFLARRSDSRFDEEKENTVARDDEFYQNFEEKSENNLVSDEMTRKQSNQDVCLALNNETTKPSYVGRIVSALDRLIMHFEYYSDQLIADGLFGLRFAEGALQKLFRKLPKSDPFYHKVHSTYERLKRLTKEAYKKTMSHKRKYDLEFDVVLKQPFNHFWPMKSLKSVAYHIDREGLHDDGNFNEMKSDLCITLMLGTAKESKGRQCVITDECLKMELTRKTKGYETTHQYLYFIAGFINGCDREMAEALGSKEKLMFEIERMAVNIAYQMLNLHSNNQHMVDLDIQTEQGLMCGLYGIVDCTKPIIVERFVSYVNAKGCTHLKKNQKKNEKRQDVDLGGCSQHQDALMSAFMALSLNTALLLPLC